MLALVALSSGGGSSDPLAWDGLTFRRYADARAHVAFSVPLTQTLLESRHFANVAETQMTDVLTLSGPSGFELEIGIWANPKQESVDAWIPEHLGFLLTSDRAQIPWHAMHGHTPAVLFEHPRTGQQFGRRTAVFAVDGKIVRITCINKDDQRAAAEFEAALDSFEVTQ